MSRNTKWLTDCALCCALCAVCAQISLPFLQVPLTLQTFAIAFCGFFLGVKAGLMTVGVYLAMGAVGLPVFSRFQGGFSVIVGPLGGFLYGFLLLCFGCAWLGGRKRAMASTIGLLLCHAVGVAHYALVCKTTFFAAFLTASAPFLWKDALSLIGAYALAKCLQKRLKRPAL